MNYIKQIQQESSDYANRINRADYAITDFMRHLTTNKFHEDTTIQVGDVNARLQEIRNIILDISQ